MSWTSPMTFTAGSTLTAAQLNAHLRDNLLETAAAKATTAGRWFIATGANALAERAILGNVVTASQTTASTSYTDLATVGPSVSIVTGTQALISWKALMHNATAGAESFMSIDTSGATTVAAADSWAVTETSNASNDRYGVSTFQLFTGLTAGTNVFKIQYKVAAGTGTFNLRQILVMAL